MRGGKTRRMKTVHSRGKRGTYQIEAICVYIKIDGKAYGSSYSIPRHGVGGANARADDWLRNKRLLAAEADLRREQK